MPRRAAQLLEEIRKLPPAERELLMEGLLAVQAVASEEAFAAWQKKVGEPEPGYDEWFRAGVEEALADTSPGAPHEVVMEDLANIVRSAREKKKLKASA